MVPVDGLAGAQPDDQHHEDAGQEDLQRVEHRLHPRDPDPGPARRPATRGGSGPGRPARRRSPRSTRRPPTMSLAVLDSRPSARAGRRCAAAAARAAGRPGSISSGTPISTTRPRVIEVCSRITATTTKETTAPAKRALTSITCPRWARSLVPIATTSPVETLRGSVAPRLHALPADELHGAVGGDQPVRHREPVPHDAAGRLHAARWPAAARPRPAAPGVAVGHPAVDRATDHGGHHGLAAHPHDAEEHPQRPGSPLLLGHPQQQPAGERWSASPGWSRGIWRTRWRLRIRPVASDPVTVWSRPPPVAVVPP